MSTPAEPGLKELQSKVTFYRRLTIGLALLVAFLAMVVIAQLTGSGQEKAPLADKPAAAESPAGAVQDAPYIRRDADDPMAIGDVDAPVVLVQWTDMRCPFCAAVHRDTLPTVIQEYVDSGKVRLELNDVSFFGEESETAAVAARAAAAQDMYFEYLDAVFGAAPGTGHAELPREKLIAFAEEVGIPDIAKFTADLDDPALRTAVQTSTAEAQRLGVSAVPFFVADGTALSGAQPIAIFRDFLDNAVDSKG